MTSGITPRRPLGVLITGSFRIADLAAEIDFHWKRDFAIQGNNVRISMWVTPWGETVFVHNVERVLRDRLAGYNHGTSVYFAPRWSDELRDHDLCEVYHIIKHREFVIREPRHGELICI